MEIISISIKKINNTSLELFKMIIVFFKIKNIKKKLGYFENVLLLNKLSINIILKILFLILDNIKIKFLKQKLNE